MLYFQFCHKSKHLREILRQSVKPKHSWALFFQWEFFTLKKINNFCLEISRLLWVTETRLLSHPASRDKSNCQDFLKCACDGQHHGCLFSSPPGLAPSLTSRSSMMRSCQTCRHHLPQSPICPQVPNRPLYFIHLFS